jgi:hypothetical protein
VTTMKKKFLIGTLVSVVASFGLWAGLGNIASAHSVVAKARPAHVVTHAVKTSAHRSASSKDPSGSDTDNVQSGDQTSPDTESTGGSEGDPSGEGASTETDGVDCQQDGNFDGVNAAGTGPGCDGSGT